MAAPPSSRSESPAEPFKRALAHAARSLGETPDLEVVFSGEGPALVGRRAVLPHPPRDLTGRDATRLRSRHEPLTPADHPVEERSPARVLEAKEQLALVLHALEGLPERTRHVLILHRFDHQSHAAIAAQLGISVSAVEKHVMNAMKLLAAKLAA